MLNFRSSQNDSPASLEYRKDIQGLRAIAVLLVLAAHANIPGLSGGFVGVDVFFVISGYLISALLIKELQNTGTIDLIRFYARRLKRLLPALALVICATAIIANQVLPLAGQTEQAKAAAAAIFWVSNIYFALTELSYFENGAESNLFLHTWSLGVEEQFYLIWPIVIIALFSLFKNVIRTDLRLRITLLVIIVTLGFLACLVVTQKDARLAFYMMPFRAWQFAFGALVFLYADSKTNLHQRTSNFFGWSGLTMIVASALILDKSFIYPGAWSLLPTLGASLLLLAGVQQSNSTGILLNLRPMQSIGNISYSWYLWHWPVLGIGYLFLSPHKLSTNVLLIMIAWVLAIVTYYLVENPMRRNKKLINFNGWQIIGALVLMASINISSVKWFNQADSEIKDSTPDFYTKAKADMPIIYGMGCDDWYQSADVRICLFGDQNAENTAAIIGDSIGLQWFPALHRIYSKPNWRILVATKSACPMVDEEFFYHRVGREYTECSQWRADLMTKLKQINPTVIVLGSAETYHFTNEQWKKGTERVLQQISLSTSKAYIIRATPGLPFDGPQCLAALTTGFAAKPNDENCSAANPHPQSTAWTSIQDAAKNFTNVFTIDLNNAVCPKGICQAELNDIVVYRDSLHLTSTFVESLVQEFELKIDENE